MDVIKNDLINLGIDLNLLGTLTVGDARVAYHKAALKVHPDKAGIEYTREY